MGNPADLADQWNRTIIGLPMDRPLRELSLARGEGPGFNTISLGEQQFKVRLANSDGRRAATSLLIKKMYSWRGYDTGAADRETPNRITLMADMDGRPIGTLTIGLDSGAGLQADALYPDALDRLRAEGCKLCEYTQFAIDQDIKSKRVLASLFHLSTIYAHRIHGATDAVIEINPRHALFYQRMLGFEPIGDERLCPRVNAPAVLLRVRYSYVVEQVARYGGAMREIAGVRSFYPYFFSPAEEAGILERLTQNER